MTQHTYFKEIDLLLKNVSIEYRYIMCFEDMWTDQELQNAIRDFSQFIKNIFNCSSNGYIR